jgi:hypothetical protein
MAGTGAAIKKCAARRLINPGASISATRGLGILAIGSFLLLQAPASAFKADPVYIDQHVTKLLEKRSDADSLAAAAVLDLPLQPDHSVTLIAKATAAAPTRPDLLWLHAQICRNTPPCDPEPIERHLRAVDPSNGSGWLGALAQATAAADDDAIDTALSAIGHSDRVDTYWTSLIFHLTQAAIQPQTVTVRGAEGSIAGSLAATVIPAYRATLDACNAGRLQRPGRLEACRNVAQALQRGDTTVTEMVGTTIAKRVWPENSPQWTAAVAARRAGDYKMKLWLTLDENNPAYAAEFLALCAESHREQDLMSAQLLRAGKDPNPPRDESVGVEN